MLTVPSLIPFRPWVDITSTFPTSVIFCTIDGAFAYNSGTTMLLDIAGSPYGGPVATITLPYKPASNTYNNLQSSIMFDPTSQRFSMLLGPKAVGFGNVWAECNRDGSHPIILNNLTTTPFVPSFRYDYVYPYNGEFIYVCHENINDSGAVFAKRDGTIIQSNAPYVLPGNWDGSWSINGAWLALSDWTGPTPNITMWTDPFKAGRAIQGSNGFPPGVLDFSKLAPPLTNAFYDSTPFGNTNEFYSHVMVRHRGNLFVNEIGLVNSPIDGITGICDGTLAGSPSKMNISYGKQSAMGLFPLSFTLNGITYGTPHDSPWITLIGDDLWSLASYQSPVTSYVLFKSGLSLGTLGSHARAAGSGAISGGTGGSGGAGGSIALHDTLNWHRNLLYGTRAGPGTSSKGF